MERIKDLGRYQKCILLLLIAMVIYFTVSYFVTTSRVGFAYMGAILTPKYENDRTVYSGVIDGEQASFTVTADHVVTFTHGSKTYGPYTAKEDPTAVPDNVRHATGVELRDSSEVIFRGGVLDTSAGWMLYDENGDLNFSITVSSSNGYILDSEGNVIDPMEPSEYTILRLMSGPKLTHKGEWGYWFLGIFASAIVAVSVLFPDELFRLRLIFRVRDVDSVEPSDWEIAGRYIGWTISVILVLVFFTKGLQ